MRMIYQKDMMETQGLQVKGRRVRRKMGLLTKLCRAAAGRARTLERHKGV